MNETDKIKIDQVYANLSKTKTSLFQNAKEFLVSELSDDREQLRELLKNDLLHWYWKQWSLSC